MFGYIGRLDDCQMYPRNVSLMPVPSKVAFIKYRHRRDAGVALHLTNSILVDKCIQVIPWRHDEMPTEAIALQQLFPGKGYGQNAQNKPNLEQSLKNADLQAAPTIPPSVDIEIREQIQRTIHVKGLDPSLTTNADLLNFFQDQCGEVKYITLAGEGDFADECDGFVEFSDITSIIAALKLENPQVNDKPITIEMSRCAILKTSMKPKTPSDAAIEIADALKAAKDGRLPSDFFGPAIGNLNPEDQVALDEKKKDRKDKDRKKRSRSRKRSRSKKRSRSRKRSKSRDRRRRSKDRSRERTKKAKRSKRSRSKERKKSRDRKRSGSRDKSEKPKEKSKTRERSKSVDRPVEKADVEMEE